MRPRWEKRTVGQCLAEFVSSEIRLNIHNACMYTYMITWYILFCTKSKFQYLNLFEELLTFNQTCFKSVSLYFWKTKLSASRFWGFESSCTIRARSTSRSGGRRMLQFLDVSIAQVEEGWLDVWMWIFGLQTKRPASSVCCVYDLWGFSHIKEPRHMDIWWYMLRIALWLMCEMLRLNQ